MKTKLLLLAVLLITLPFAYSLIYVKKATITKKSFSEENIQFLADIGMTESKTLKDNVDMIDYTIKKAYLAKYGVSYFSADGITALMKVHNLVMGELSGYKGEIPEKNIVEFKANYEKLKPEQRFTHYYFSGADNDNAPVPEYLIKPDEIDRIKSYPGSSPWAGIVLKRDLYGIGYVRYSENKIPLPIVLKIVAPEKYFKMDGKQVNEDNEIVDKKVDPMILMEHEGGWLVLTMWFN